VSSLLLLLQPAASILLAAVVLGEQPTVIQLEIMRRCATLPWDTKLGPSRCGLGAGRGVAAVGPEGAQLC
jgi:hypothetical protein